MPWLVQRRTRHASLCQRHKAESLSQQGKSLRVSCNIQCLRPMDSNALPYAVMAKITDLFAGWESHLPHGTWHPAGAKDTMYRPCNRISRHRGSAPAPLLSAGAAPAAASSGPPAASGGRPGPRRTRCRRARRSPPARHPARTPPPAPAAPHAGSRVFHLGLLIAPQHRLQQALECRRTRRSPPARHPAKTPPPAPAAPHAGSRVFHLGL